MITVNGTPVLCEGMTLSGYLETTDYNLARIAVEKNGEIVPKAQYETTTLREGDTLEVVSFVGGG